MAGRRKVRNSRQQQEEGFKRVRIRVPDTSAPGFAEECRRQSLRAQKVPKSLEDLEAFAVIATWGDDKADLT